MLVTIASIQQVFPKIFALELEAPTRPDNTKLQLIACCTLEEGSFGLRQLSEVLPNNCLKELSRDHHPFTPAGTVEQRHRDYKQAFAAIQEELDLLVFDA